MKKLRKKGMTERQVVVAMACACQARGCSCTCSPCTCTSNASSSTSANLGNILQGSNSSNMSRGTVN